MAAHNTFLDRVNLRHMLLLMAAAGVASGMIYQLVAAPRPPATSGRRVTKRVIPPVASLDGHWRVDGAPVVFSTRNVSERELWRTINLEPVAGASSVKLETNALHFLESLAPEATRLGHTVRRTNTSESLVVHAYLDRETSSRLLVAFVAYPQTASRERWTLVTLLPNQAQNTAARNRLAILPPELTSSCVATRHDLTGTCTAAFLVCDRDQLALLLDRWVAAGGDVAPSPYSAARRPAFLCQRGVDAYQLIAFPSSDTQYSVSIVDLRAMKSSATNRQ